MPPKRPAKRRAKPESSIVVGKDDDLKEWAEVHKCEDCSYEEHCQKYSDPKTEMPER